MLGFAFAIMLSSEQIAAANEAAKKYLMTFVPKYNFRNGYQYEPLFMRCIGIDASARGISEPFYLNWSEFSLQKYKYPIYLTYGQLTKLLGGSRAVYGRTQWGPWTRVNVFKYEVTSVCILNGTELEECERIIQKELEGE